MEIESAGAAPAQAIVTVANGINHQLEKVVGTLISGLDSTSAAIQDGIGRLLDVVA